MPESVMERVEKYIDLSKPESSPQQLTQFIKTNYLEPLESILPTQHINEFNPNDYSRINLWQRKIQCSSFENATKIIESIKIDNKFTGISNEIIYFSTTPEKEKLELIITLRGTIPNDYLSTTKAMAENLMSKNLKKITEIEKNYNPEETSLINSFLKDFLSENSSILSKIEYPS